MKKSVKKPLASTLGAAFLVSASMSAMADVNSNPFNNNQLDQGYDLVSKAKHEGKCGEGKCGGEHKADKDKKKDKKHDKRKKHDKTDKEGKCGEGKCGGEKAGGEGKCGEGKCGSKE